MKPVVLGEASGMVGVRFKLLGARQLKEKIEEFIGFGVGISSDLV